MSLTQAAGVKSSNHSDPTQTVNFLCFFFHSKEREYFGLHTVAPSPSSSRETNKRTAAPGVDFLLQPTDRQPSQATTTDRGEDHPAARPPSHQRRPHRQAAAPPQIHCRPLHTAASTDLPPETEEKMAKPQDQT